MRQRYIGTDRMTRLVRTMGRHLHPTQAADGTWSTPVKPPKADGYRAFADFKPESGEALTLGADLAASGTSEPPRSRPNTHTEARNSPGPVGTPAHSQQQTSHMPGELARCSRTGGQSPPTGRYDHGMVTAWTPRRRSGTRLGAGPLLRVVALAVLLFSVLVTHGANVESAQGHLSTSAMAPAAAPVEHTRDAAVDSAPQLVAAADGRHGGHEPSHPGEQCASGQPQQSSVSGTPCFAASVRESFRAVHASAVRLPTAEEPRAGATSAALRAASVVRQV